MMHISKQNSAEETFLEILENTKNNLISKLQNSQSLPNPTQFEAMVYEVMKVEAVGTEFEGLIKQTSTTAFPDIVAGIFGVEVKMTAKDQWRSVGNSVLESLREAGIDKVYVLFGKLGGVPDIKYRLYQDCLPAVSVTHSPRYQIDMNLSLGKSIFDKIGTTYDQLRQSGNTIEQIKNYYRSELKSGEGLWWIDEESEVRSPIIKQFHTLESADKEMFKIDCLILFSELFKGRANYERAATYMMTELGAVSTNLRDVFSAGGQEEIALAGEKKSVSQLFFQLYTLAPQILKRLNGFDKATLEFYWPVSLVLPNRVNQWQELIDQAGGDKVDTWLPSEIFQAGLRE
ncbi:hypothetical protein KC845_03155 [Candidatus Kaiserbacteria bacterium]|nr:hypothetical protein [Candidatus Kaiserbacteria bacterium]